MDIQFECIWKKNASEYQQKAIDLWNKFNMLDGNEVTLQRAKEIVFVARKNDEVIGVTTVRPLQVKLLNNNYFYEFRIFISPEHRTPALDVKLALKTKRFLESTPDASEYPCIGLIVVVENEAMKNNWVQAVWPVVDMVFAGYTPKGDHIRVAYFKGARI